ncbi:hypothetical protein D6T63_04225 [Arthrobacter cheniae]|uniref:Uncharacterized protein n=1 Tax=Arthrobacter cheniae TaxID=1258888 RepID=A0A3A5MAE4_9MICC|nr:hypothetical protein [Arthrobacter cheniae]RJT81961.1 hypothetical protein D6T63_04225 [Arthrobacter cheniae]
MPQKHDPKQRKRNRPAEVISEPVNGDALAQRLVDAGLAGLWIHGGHLTPSNSPRKTTDERTTR